MNTRTIAEIAACVIVLVVFWYTHLPDKQPVDTWHPAPVAPQVKGVPKVVITPKAVTVYAPAAKKRLNLPSESNTDVQVLSANRLNSDLRPQTVVSELNTQTGEVETVIRREAYPWLASESRGEIRLDYGYKYQHSEVTKVARLAVQYDFVQIKALHAGVMVALDNDGQGYAGIGVAWKW